MWGCSDADVLFFFFFVAYLFKFLSLKADNVTFSNNSQSSAHGPLSRRNSFGSYLSFSLLLAYMFAWLRSSSMRGPDAARGVRVRHVNALVVRHAGGQGQGRVPRLFVQHAERLPHR